MSHAKHLIEQRTQRPGVVVEPTTMPTLPEMRDRILELEQILGLVIGVSIELCRESYALAKARGDSDRVAKLLDQGQILKSLGEQIAPPF